MSPFGQHREAASPHGLSQLARPGCLPGWGKLGAGSSQYDTEAHASYLELSTFFKNKCLLDSHVALGM